jgi:hypothetical protein
MLDLVSRLRLIAPLSHSIACNCTLSAPNGVKSLAPYGTLLPASSSTFLSAPNSPLLLASNGVPRLSVPLLCCRALPVLHSPLLLEPSSCPRRLDIPNGVSTTADNVKDAALTAATVMSIAFVYGCCLDVIHVLVISNTLVFFRSAIEQTGTNKATQIHNTTSSQ